jgi:hypothetical protein
VACRGSTGKDRATVTGFENLLSNVGEFADPTPGGVIRTNLLRPAEQEKRINDYFIHFI